MSSTHDVRRVHRSETKFKLRPHLHVPGPEFEHKAITRDQTGHLRVKLQDLLSPKAYRQLKELRLIP